MSPTNPPPSGKPGDGGGSRPARADWRGKAKPTGPAGRPAQQRGAIWKEKTDLEYRRAKRRYRIKLAGLAVGAVALVAWLFCLYIYPLFLVRTPFLAVVVTQYGPSAESPGSWLIPPNGWAEEDARRFETLGTGAAGTKIADFATVDYPRWQTTKEGFQELQERIRKSKRRWALGPGRDTVIVYLSMHGAVNQDNEACLIPPGLAPADLLDSRNWLRLHEVLAFLFPKDDSSSLPQHKLLILDCNRMDANWGLGLLYNGFADRLQDALDTAKVPGLVILNSTSPGQVGWTSPEQFQFQGSVFGHYVWLGLMGEADRERQYWPDREGYYDGQVSLQELHRYVSTHVQSWVQAYCADAQVPMLVARDEDQKDFALVYALTASKLAKVKEEWAPKDYQRDDRWDRVAKLWAVHAKLQERTAWAIDPLGWEEFQHGLLQLEQFVLAGGAYRTEFDKRQSKLVELAKKLGEDPLAPSVRAYSLPLASRFSRPAAIDPEAKRLLEQFHKQPNEERWPRDLLAFAEKTRQAGKADGTRPPRGYPGARQPDVIEWHFVRMLQDYLDPEVRSGQPRLVKQALLARDAAESAAAPADVRVHYWLHGLVDAADQQRRPAEDRLFLGSREALQKAQEGFDAAVGKVGSGGYAEAQSRAEAVAKAFELRDRALARTPYLAQWVLARLNQNDPAALSKELADLILATRGLGWALDRELGLQTGGASAEAVPLLKEREEAENAVRSPLEKLEDAYKIACNLPESTTPEADAGVLRQITTVLAVPLVTGEKRVGLRNRSLEILERLGKVSREAGAGGEGPVRRAAEGSQPGEQQGSDVRFLERMPRASEHPALILLSRAGLQERKHVLPKTAAAAPKPSAGEPRDSQRARQELELKKKDLATQGGEVRRLLASTYDDATERAKKTKDNLGKGSVSAAEARSGLSEADRLVRASAPLWQTELARWEAGTDPVGELRRFDACQLLLWHCRRTLEDFWGPPRGDPAAPSYFDAVAGEYLASAVDLCKDAAGRQQDLSQLFNERRAAARQPVRATITDVQIVPGDPSTRADAAVSEAANLPPGEAALWLESADQRQVLPLFASAADAEKPSNAGMRRVKLAVPGQAKNSSYWVRSSEFGLDNAGAKSRNYQGVSLYRGHRVSLGFLVTLPGAGVQIVFQPPQDPKQSITVKGDVKTQAYVVFILDYSGSMMKWIAAPPQPPKAGGQQGNPGLAREQRRRYEDARGTLLTILAKLANVTDTPYRVGVMVYGHRYNYASVLRGAGFDVPADARYVKRDPKNPNAFVSADSDPLFTQTNASGERKTPSEDVELIWPVRREDWPPGPWTPASADEVRKKLEPLRPMGETPLYLAVSQAIDLLNEAAAASPGGAAASKHIVVITDGVNYQSEHKTFMADVADRFAKAGRGIRLDIIGYLLTDETARQEAEQLGLSPEDVRGAVDDLRALAQNHGGDRGLPPEERGEFYSARDSSALQKQLEASLRLSRFVVYRAGATPSEISKLEPIDLGLSWKVTLGPDDLAKPGGVPFVVKLVDPSRQAEAKARLEGGEALLLYLSADGQRLEHERYRFQIRQDEARSDVRDPLDAGRRLYIAPHLPESKGSAVRFLFSIQNQDERLFSPRPEEIWLEIRPVLKDPEAAPLYVFYDAQYAPECPVPVLECTAPQWPGDAIEASVRLWCKFTRTKPYQVLRLSELFANKQPGEAVRLEGFAPEKIPGLDLELRQKSDQQKGIHQVIVTERYPRAAEPGAQRPLNALKVEMDPRPREAVHHYIPEAGIVRNTFTYALDGFRAGRTPPYVVRVTLRDEALKDAITVDPPLRVTVPRDRGGPR